MEYQNLELDVGLELHGRRVSIQGRESAVEVGLGLELGSMIRIWVKIGS